MKKILTLIGCVLSVGCAAQPYCVEKTSYYSYYPAPRIHRDDVQIALNQAQIEAAQMNELMSGVYGPENRYSAALLRRQNYLRETNANLQNPWNSFFQTRNYYR